MIARSKALNVGTFQSYDYDEDKKEEKDIDALDIVLNPLLANWLTPAYYARCRLRNYNERGRAVDGKVLLVEMAVRSMPEGLQDTGHWRKVLVANRPMRVPMKLRIGVCCGMLPREWHDAALEADATLGVLADQMESVVREVTQSKRLKAAEKWQRMGPLG